MMNGKQILQPILCCNSIIGEIDNVFPLDNVAGDAPAEMVVYVILQINLFIVRKTVEIYLRLIGRSVIDRNQLNIAARKIRIAKEALDGTAGELDFIISRHNN